MDVNGTRFHLYLGARDWVPRVDAAGVRPGDRPVWWDAAASQVTLHPELFQFGGRPSETPFTASDRRGAARDRFGHFYWIAPDRRSIRYRARDDNASARFWSVDAIAGEPCAPAAARGAFGPAAAPPAPTALPWLSGLTVTARHFLVVGTIAPSGLLVFDLHGGGPAVWMRWPDAVPFAPFDFAATPDGGAWILDRPSPPGACRLWRLDAHLRVVRAADDVEVPPAPTPDAFRPVDPAAAACTPPRRTFPRGISLVLASPPVPADGDPMAVVALPDGSAIVMETDALEGDTLLHRWTLSNWIGGAPPAHEGEPLGAPASLADALADLLETPATLVGYDMAFVADASPQPGLVSGIVYVAEPTGNQSVAFTLSTGVRGTAESTALDVTAQPSYLPMRRWDGKALISQGSDVYYDHGDGWLPLAAVPRPRFATRGVLDGLLFDGAEPGCVWHRLLVDGCIPPGDTVDVESRAADAIDELPGLAFRSEPTLRLRPSGSELPWTRVFTDTQAATPGVGTWELLFQAATGRYLELRITLRGSGRSSPKLRALRVYYPRFSYLQYLPDVYRDDQTSASLLDRFFANFEGTLTELEGRIESAQVLFDESTAPPETLDWLASWLGASLDSTWDTARRQLFIANAVDLYRRRGTRRGLLAALRVSLDPCPSGDLFADDDVAQPFGFRLSEAFRGGDAGAAHRFTVLAPVGLSTSQADRIKLRDSAAAVVERERPAHAAFDVQLYWGLFRVGSARVGQDTALGEGSRVSALLLGSSYLGESALTEAHPWTVADRRVVGRDRLGYPPPLA